MLSVGEPTGCVVSRKYTGIAEFGSTNITRLRDTAKVWFPRFLQLDHLKLPLSRTISHIFAVEFLCPASAERLTVHALSSTSEGQGLHSFALSQHLIRLL